MLGAIHPIFSIHRWVLDCWSGQKNTFQEDVDAHFSLFAGILNTNLEND